MNFARRMLRSIRGKEHPLESETKKAHDQMVESLGGLRQEVQKVNSTLRLMADNISGIKVTVETVHKDGTNEKD